MKIELNKAPMGWNSYDYYDTTVNEKQVKENALFMAKNLKQYGWQYIVVDIQWYAKDAGTQRDKYQYVPFGNHQIDEYGRLQPDVDRFPSAADGKGFKPLADYIHELGLKFGIHIMRGIPREAAHKHLPVSKSSFLASDIADPTSICPWNPDMYGLRGDCEGSQEYYDSIISMYADWGVDFIKCDDICNNYLFQDDKFNGWAELKMLHTAIEKSNRNIVLSLSPGPAQIEKAWEYRQNANMWRITDDFWDSWESLENMFYRCELWQKHVAAGAYPDCDMLPIGWVGKGFCDERLTNFTYDEQKTMMTLWCMFGSPLMIGGELISMDEKSMNLLCNADLLMLIENKYRGSQELRTRDTVVWSKISEDKTENYIAIFNLKDVENTVSFSIDCCNSIETKIFSIAEELWSKEKFGVKNNILNFDIPAHGVKVFKLFSR